MSDTPDIFILDAALARLREIDALFADLDVGVCALHLDACIASLESRLLKAKSGEVPMRRIIREVGSPTE